MEAKFDWFRELTKACLKSPTEKEHENMSNLSASWVTCACGNICDALPRNEKNVPEDSILKNLGCNFSDHIVDGEWLEAFKVLNLIESRVAILLINQNSVLNC